MEDQDIGGKEKDKDKDRRQGGQGGNGGGTWGGLFGGAGGGGGSGGMSPTRSAEVKKAIRAAMAFGLPKGKGGEEVAKGKASPGNEIEIETDGSGNETVKGIGTSLFFLANRVRELWW